MRSCCCCLQIIVCPHYYSVAGSLCPCWCAWRLLRLILSCWHHFFCCCCGIYRYCAIHFRALSTAVRSTEVGFAVVAVLFVPILLLRLRCVSMLVHFWLHFTSIVCQMCLSACWRIYLRRCYSSVCGSVCAASVVVASMDAANDDVNKSILSLLCVLGTGGGIIQTLFHNADRFWCCCIGRKLYFRLFFSFQCNDHQVLFNLHITNTDILLSLYGVYFGRLLRWVLLQWRWIRCAHLKWVQKENSAQLYNRNRNSRQELVGISPCGTMCTASLVPVA